MSWTRIFLITFLGIMLVGVIALGAFQWYKSYPAYYYGQAQRDIAREDYESAKLNLLKLVIKHPTHADGHHLLSEVVLDEARSQGRAATYAANPAAISHLAKAVELRPQEIEWRRRLLSALLQTRQISKAAEVAEQIYAEDKTNGDAHLALTWRAVQAQNTEEAERLFADSNNVVSRHVFHEFALKLTYYSQVPGAENSDEYRKALLGALHTAEGLSEDELRLLAYRDRELMLQVLLNAQHQLLDPGDKTKAATILIGVCEKLQRAELLDKLAIAEAASASQQNLSADPSMAELSEEDHLARQRLLGRSGDIAADAVAATTQDGGQSPLAAYWTNAVALFRDGGIDEPLRVLGEGIHVADQLGEAADAQRMAMHLLSARILMTERRYAEAVEQLEPLKDDDHYEGWGNLLRGKMALHDGQYAAAESELHLAEQKLEEHLLDLHMGLAIVAMRRGKPEEAIEHMEAVLAPDEQLQPYDVAWRQRQPGLFHAVHLDLLKARLKLGQWDESQQHLAELRETSRAPEAWKLAIDYLRSDGQAERAWNYVRRVRERYPDETDFVFLEADMLEEAGKSARAEFVFQDFVALKPHEPVRKLAMARWLLMQEKPQQALPLLEELATDVTLTPKARNTVFILAAQAHLQIREFDTAQKLANALIANPDTKPAGHLLDSMIAFADGDSQLADQKLAEMHLANARQIGRDRSVVHIRHLNGDLVGAVVQNTYYW